MEAAEAEAILEVECGAPPLDGASVAEGGGVESRPSPLLLVTSISRGREKEVVIGLSFIFQCHLFFSKYHSDSN